MLERFGEPFISFKGQGSIKYKIMGVERTEEVNFECVQLHNSAIIIEASLEITSFRLLSLLDVDTVTFFEGILDDGRNFWVTGSIAIYEVQLNNSDSRMTFVLSVEKIEVSKSYIDINLRPAKLRFFVTNLKFIGTEIHKDSSENTRLVLPLEIAETKVNLFNIENYSALIQQLEATKFPKVTSYIEILDIKGPVEESEVIAFQLCMLLSFAKGTRISWIGYEVLDAGGSVISNQHKSTFTSIYTGISVIDQRHPNELKGFIEQVYDKFTGIAVSYNLQSLIDANIQAKEGNKLADTLGLMVGSAVDIVRGKWAQLNHRDYILDEKEFKKGKDRFKKGLVKLFEEIYGEDANQVSEMKAKITELNRTSFQTVLKEMRASLKADISDKEIERFVKTRNSLVHQGVFDKDNYDPVFIRNELLNIYNFADRLVLAILNYHGPYLDCRNWERIDHKLIEQVKNE